MGGTCPDQKKRFVKIPAAAFSASGKASSATVTQCYRPALDFVDRFDPRQPVSGQWCFINNQDKVSNTTLIWFELLGCELSPISVGWLISMLLLTHSHVDDLGLGSSKEPRLELCVQWTAHSAHAGWLFFLFVVWPAKIGERCYIMVQNHFVWSPSRVTMTAI